MLQTVSTCKLFPWNNWQFGVGDGQGDSTESSRKISDRLRVEAGGKVVFNVVCNRTKWMLSSLKCFKKLVTVLAGVSHFAIRKRTLQEASFLIPITYALRKLAYLPNLTPPLSKNGVVGELKNTWHGCKKAENVWQSSQASFSTQHQMFYSLREPI